MKRFYEQLDVNTPMPHEPHFINSIQLIAAMHRQLKPWTLIELPGESGLTVARRRNFVMRVVTWWCNLFRRRERARLQQRIAHHFAPEQVAARARRTQ